jgi:acyl carrier protein
LTRDDIRTVVLRNVRQIIEGAEGKEIRDEMSMRDLGADSLEIVEVVSRSMKELRIRVPRTELSTAKNLADLLDLFERAAARPTA